MCFCLILDKVQLMSRSLSKCLLFCWIFFFSKWGILKPWLQLCTSKLLPASLEKPLSYPLHRPRFKWNLNVLKIILGWKWSTLVPRNQKKPDEELKEIQRQYKATTRTINIEKMDVCFHWDTPHCTIRGCRVKQQQQK